MKKKILTINDDIFGSRRCRFVGRDRAVVFGGACHFQSVVSRSSQNLYCCRHKNQSETVYNFPLLRWGCIRKTHTHEQNKKKKRKLATDNGPRRRARVYRKLFCWSGQRREKAKLNNFFFVNVFDAKQTLIKMQLTTKTKFEWRWKIRRGGCCTKLCCGAAAKVFFFFIFFCCRFGFAYDDDDGDDYYLLLVLA